MYAGGRRDVADDAVAEAFARAMAQGPVVREPVPYMFRIAFRLASAEMQREARFSEIEDRAVTDAVADPDLLSAIRELSPTQRGAVYLHYRVDLPVRDVASILGISSSAVKVHLMRGRRRLAVLLGEDES